MKFKVGDVVRYIGDSKTHSYPDTYKDVTFRVSEHLKTKIDYRPIVRLILRERCGRYYPGTAFNFYEDTLTLVEPMHAVCKKILMLEQRHKRFLEKKQQRIDYDSIPF